MWCRAAGEIMFDAPGRANHVGSVMSKTLFEKIIAREIPATIVFEDDKVVAFRDVNPQAPVHALIVPRHPIPRIAEARPEDHQVLGHLLLKAAEVAEKLGLTRTGFRLVINNGPDAAESVPHLHCHIIGGRKMSWPPG
jgi:histidine triad (HIT) family protein